MIKIKGSLKLRGDYEVELDMSEAEFEALSEREQNDWINDSVDWRNWIDNADLNDLDIDEISDGGESK